ncbi:MAG: TonB family protein [Alphaproteobacteria bacterium]|jgi:protein TonB|nr:TonB family protein [Alphaproteobacteria bacterium]
MTVQALSLYPAGRQPDGISGRHAAPPAPVPERARGSFFERRERHAPWAMSASLLLHAVVAGVALAALGSETMGGSGGGAGEAQGGGILVELVALAPAADTAAAAAAPKDAVQAEENKEAEAPKTEAASQVVTLPPPPVEADAFPLNFRPPEPAQKAKAEDKPKPVEKAKVEAKREALKPAPAKAIDPKAPQQAKPADTASAPAPAATADTAASHGEASDAGASGPAATGGAGGKQVAALGSVGTRILQARFRVTPPPPPYPRRALSQHQEGVVLLRALIDEQGAARQIKLQATSGYPLLDKAALEAVGEWQFMPETVNGRPVAVWVEVPVRFRIN